MKANADSMPYTLLEEPLQTAHRKPLWRVTMDGSGKSLRRSRQQKLIGGVCGGIAEWLGWNVTTVRFLYVVVSVLSAAFPGILAYLVLWIAMPQGE